MDYLVVCGVALVASGLTLFSGFGLGTLLLPAFLLFFPPDLAVGMTAVVHFVNNLFKLTLFVRKADPAIVVKFGVPAVLASFAGAWVLLSISQSEPLFSYEFLNRHATVTPLKILMAVLIMSFAFFESLPANKSVQLESRWLPLGGLLSGFFGGLSGHQGALRSVFLLHLNLSKEVFIGTGVVVACFVDATRVTVYGRHFVSAGIQENVLLVVVASLSAIGGVLLARKVSEGVTMQSIQRIVAVLLFVIAIGLGIGIV